MTHTPEASLISRSLSGSRPMPSRRNLDDRAAACTTKVSQIGRDFVRRHEAVVRFADTLDTSQWRCSWVSVGPSSIALISPVTVTMTARGMGERAKR